MLRKKGRSRYCVRVGVFAFVCRPHVIGVLVRVREGLRKRVQAVTLGTLSSRVSVPNGLEAANTRSKFGHSDIRPHRPAFENLGTHTSAEELDIGRSCIGHSKLPRLFRPSLSTPRHLRSTSFLWLLSVMTAGEKRACQWKSFDVLNENQGLMASLLSKQIGSWQRVSSGSEMF